MNSVLFLAVHRIVPVILFFVALYFYFIFENFLLMCMAGAV